MAAKTEYQASKSKSSQVSRSRKYRKQCVDHDTKWFCDSAMQALIEEAGLDAVAIIQLVADLSWLEADCKLSLNPTRLKGAARLLPHLTAERIIEVLNVACRPDISLAERDETHVWIPFRYRQAEDYAEFCESRGVAGRASGLSRKPATPVQTPRTPVQQGPTPVQKSEHPTTSPTDPIDPIDPKGGAGGSEPLEPPSELDKHFLLDTPEILANPQRGAGRRPLKDFSALWLSAPELARVIEIHKQHPGISQKRIFEKAQAKAINRPRHQWSTFNAFTALTGYELENELKLVKAERDEQRATLFTARAAAEVAQ